jgi:hypothetical protein
MSQISYMIHVILAVEMCSTFFIYLGFVLHLDKYFEIYD